MAIDPEGKRLPIKLDTATNGEYPPRPLPYPVLVAKRLAHDQASDVEPISIHHCPFHSLTFFLYDAGFFSPTDKALAHEGVT